MRRVSPELTGKAPTEECNRTCAIRQSTPLRSEFRLMTQPHAQKFAMPASGGLENGNFSGTC